MGIDDYFPTFIEEVIKIEITGVKFRKSHVFSESNIRVVAYHRIILCIKLILSWVDVVSVIYPTPQDYEKLFEDTALTNSLKSQEDDRWEILGTDLETGFTKYSWRTFFFLLRLFQCMWPLYYYLPEVSIDEISQYFDVIL